MTTEAPEVIDGTVDESHELVPAPQPANLFRTDDPAESLKRAEATANALAPVIRRAGLVQNISGKDYLTVEAWQTLGAQVGVTPVTSWTRRLTDPVGWEARCEARTLDGRTLGAAESMCLRSEERWADSPDFEIRSMAQTRAMSRALASVLRFIPTLAGFAGTPAEEMQNHGGSRSGPIPPSDKQLDFLMSLAKQNGADGNDQEQIRAYAAENLTGGKNGSTSKTIERLKDDGGVFLLDLTRAAHEWAAAQPDVPADADGLPA